MASINCTAGMTGIVDRSIDYVNGVIKARLIASSETPAKSTTAMTGFEALDADLTLTGKSIVADQVNARTILKCADLVFEAVAAGSEAGWIAIFADGADDAARVPICFIDVADIPTNGGDLTYATPTVGGEANVLTYLAV